MSIYEVLIQTSVARIHNGYVEVQVSTQGVHRSRG